MFFDMKREDFSEKVCDIIEPTIIEISEKIRTGDYDNEDLILFWRKMENDINKFLGEENLEIKFRYPRNKTNM